MGARRRITIGHLKSTVDKFPPNIYQDDTFRTYHLAVSIVKYFFGIEWVTLNFS